MARKMKFDRLTRKQQKKAAGLTAAQTYRIEPRLFNPEQERRAARAAKTAARAQQARLDRIERDKPLLVSQVFPALYLSGKMMQEALRNYETTYDNNWVSREAHEAVYTRLLKRILKKDIEDIEDLLNPTKQPHPQYSLPIWENSGCKTSPVTVLVHQFGMSRFDDVKVTTKFETQVPTDGSGKRKATVDDDTEPSNKRAKLDNPNGSPITGGKSSLPVLSKIEDDDSERPRIGGKNFLSVLSAWESWSGESIMIKIEPETQPGNPVQDVAHADPVIYIKSEEPDDVAPPKYEEPAEPTIDHAYHFYTILKERLPYDIGLPKSLLEILDKKGDMALLWSTLKGWEVLVDAEMSLERLITRDRALIEYEKRLEQMRQFDEKLEREESVLRLANGLYSDSDSESDEEEDDDEDEAEIKVEEDVKVEFPEDDDEDGWEKMKEPKSYGWSWTWYVPGWQRPDPWPPQLAYDWTKPIQRRPEMNDGSCGV